MSLSTVVQARVSAEQLVQLTQQGDRAATTIDTDVLAAACADAEAEWQLETGVAFDSTVAAHAALGWVGVLYYLHSYAVAGADQAATDKLRTRWERGLAKAARLLGSDMPLLAQTLSPLEREVEATTRRADNDRAAWRDYMLDRGPSGGPLEDLNG